MQLQPSFVRTGQNSQPQAEVTALHEFYTAALFHFVSILLVRPEQRSHWRAELVSPFFLDYENSFRNTLEQVLSFHTGICPTVIPVVNASRHSHLQDCSPIHYCFLIALFHSAKLWHMLKYPAGDLNKRRKSQGVAVAAALPRKTTLYLTGGGTRSLPEPLWYVGATLLFFQANK